MKFLLAANDKDVNEPISPVFARAYFFAIYDTETKKVSFVDNEATKAQGGAGVQAAQEAVDLNVDKVIVVRLGENSFNVLKMTDIEVLQTKSDSMINIFHMCEHNQLSVLERVSKGFHHHNG